MTIWSRGLRVALLGLVALFLVWGGTAIFSQDEVTNTPVAAAPSGIGTPTPGPCDPAFVQEFDPNRDDRFVSDGIRNAREDLEHLGHDARNLAFRAEVLGLREGHNPNELLTPDEQCLSREGQDLFNQVKGALTGEGVTVNNNGMAPADGYNTEMVNGQPVVASEAGISGDRSAVVYTLRDGSKLYVMKRCANVVLPEPTPNPEPTPSNPPTPTPTTPTPTTPPPPNPTCPPDMPHGEWPNCKDDPSNQPPGNNPNGNNPGGHNDTDGPGEPNPEPTFPTTPYTPPPPPKPSSPPNNSTPAPTNQPTPSPEPSSNPSDGSGNNGDPGGF